MEINGEYWITETGTLIFCDGDSGVDVPNHIMVVATHALSMLVAKLEQCKNPAAHLFVSLLQDDSEVLDVPALRGLINDAVDSWHRDGIVNEEICDDWAGWIVKQIGEEDLVRLVFDPFGDEHDARGFAMRRWNWVRIAGNTVTLPRIDSEICERLAEALCEICDEDWASIPLTVECLNPSNYAFGITGLTASDPKTLRRALLPVNSSIAAF